MSLVQEYHEAHKARLARMSGPPKVIAIKEPGAEIDDLKVLVATLSERVDELSRQLNVHDAVITQHFAQEDEGKPRLSEIIDSVCGFYRVRQVDVVGSRHHW